MKPYQLLAYKTYSDSVCVAMQAAFKPATTSSNSKADIDWAAVKVEDKYLMHQVSQLQDRLHSCLSVSWLACSVQMYMLTRRHSLTRHIVCKSCWCDF